MPNRKKIIHVIVLFKNFGKYSSMQVINMYIHKQKIRNIFSPSFINAIFEIFINILYYCYFKNFLSRDWLNGLYWLLSSFEIMPVTNNNYIN